MFDHLRADTRRLRESKRKPFPWYVLESLLFDSGYQAVVLHRIAHWLKANGVPALGPAVARLNQLLTGVEIGPGAVIGPGLRMSVDGPASTAKTACEYLAGEIAKLGVRSTACVSPAP